MADVINTAGQDAGNSLAPEGHDQAMIDKVDQKSAEIAAAGQPPAEQGEGELILGKFKSQEDLAKAYQELERKLGGNDKPDEGHTEEAADDTSDDAEDATEDEANEAVESAGLNMEDLSRTYDETGDLSDEQYEALEKVGITREYVQTYIEGLQARSATVRASVLNEVGGEEKFASMVDWAKVSMTPAELTQYNEAIDSGDVERIRTAVTGLAYRYGQANGEDPTLVGGDAAASAGDTFKSVAQLTQAMSDERYEKDPAYRQEVEDRLARSSIM